jgi:hypothetical protein
MGTRKRWYDPDAELSVRVIPQDDRNQSFNSARWRHPRVAPRLGECLLYPLTDGPGLGLLIILPPILFMLSLPIFDVIAVIQPLTKGDWALGLLVIPVLIPMLFSFSMVFGYALLFLGHVLVASSMGENDHPRWPEWHPSDISEGICRWFWAALFGVAIGGFPVALYWEHCGDIDWFDWVVFGELAMVGVSYTLMALSASLLHENIIAANPYTVIAAIARVGWDYVQTCLVASVALFAAGLAFWVLLYKMPAMWSEALSLWIFWAFLYYEAMVVIRMMGLTYHAHALDLGWFRRRPRWATSTRDGRIYANS